MSKKAQSLAPSFEAVIEVAQPVQAEFQLGALMTELKTKSAVIRHLASKGKDRSWIAKFMGIRYQHVRNVLTQPLKQAE